MSGLVINKPSVSVVLTVYNREKYLNRCITSLLNQSFDDWELIAIDDGSKDDSYKVLKYFELMSSKIKVIHQENRKLALSRNRGIELSNGKHITFLDSDDEYEKDHLEKRIDFMIKNLNVDLIHGGVKVIGNNYVPDKNNPLKLIHLSDCTIGATFFGKREVFEFLKGFKNLPYSEDSEFLERAELFFNIKKVDYKTYIYHREVPDSITNNYKNTYAEVI